MLARALATPSNLLVLDEPTNDLDLETLDLLQEMIADYPGTVILVSHDRDFLDRTVTSLLAAEGDGRWVEYAGGYSDMLAQRGERRSACARSSRRRRPLQGSGRAAASRGRAEAKALLQGEACARDAARPHRGASCRDRGVQSNARRPARCLHAIRRPSTGLRRSSKLPSSSSPLRKRNGSSSKFYAKRLKDVRRALTLPLRRLKSRLISAACGPQARQRRGGRRSAARSKQQHQTAYGGPSMRTARNALCCSRRVGRRRWPPTRRRTWRRPRSRRTASGSSRRSRPSGSATILSASRRSRRATAATAPLGTPRLRRFGALCGEPAGAGRLRRSRAAFHGDSSSGEHAAGDASRSRPNAEIYRRSTTSPPWTYSGAGDVQAGLSWRRRHRGCRRDRPASIQRAAASRRTFPARDRRQRSR